MPSGTVEHHNRDGTHRDRAADHREMLVHRLDIDLRHDDRRTNATLRAGGAKQISPGKAAIFLYTWTRAAPGPDPGYRALLTNPGFILEPDLERAVEGAFRRERGAEQRGEVFLKASCAASSL